MLPRAGKLHTHGSVLLSRHSPHEASPLLSILSAQRAGLISTTINQFAAGKKSLSQTSHNFSQYGTFAPCTI
jgi:hypothetical protein